MLSLAIAQGDADWEAEIVAAFHRLSRTPLPSGAHSDEKARLWEQRHRAFHAALVAGCASPWLMRLHDQLVDQTERYRLIRLQNLSKRKPLARDIHSEHEALMNALLDRNEKVATRLIRGHLQATFEATAKWLPAD